MIEHIHGDRIDHRYFALIVFKDEHHVEIFQLELNTFEVNKFQVFQRYNKRRLKSNEFVSIFSNTVHITYHNLGSFFLYDKFEILNTTVTNP